MILEIKDIISEAFKSGNYGGYLCQAYKDINKEIEEYYKIPDEELTQEQIFYGQHLMQLQLDVAVYIADYYALNKPNLERN